jgi:hypothetical protein
MIFSSVPRIHPGLFSRQDSLRSLQSFGQHTGMSAAPTQLGFLVKVLLALQNPFE